MLPPPSPVCLLIVLTSFDLVFLLTIPIWLQFAPPTFSQNKSENEHPINIVDFTTHQL